MAPSAKKGHKKGGNAKKWPLPPGHAASISALETYMGKIMHGPLRTGLEAVSGDNTLPTAEALLLIADFLEGSKAGQTAIRQRLDKRHADPESGISEGGMDNRVRGEMDHAIVVSITRAVERTMMLRLGWKETDSPLMELSRQLMIEARAHAQSDPKHFLSPSLPPEESFTFSEFQDAIGEAVFHVMENIRTGSMLMLVEYRLIMVEGGAEEGSLAELAQMVESEGKAIKSAADEVAMMMMKAIKRQRRIGGMMTEEHRQEVNVGLSEVHDVLAGVVGDITASLQSTKELLQMSASESRLKDLEDAVDEEAAAEEAEKATEADLEASGEQRNIETEDKTDDKANPEGEREVEAEDADDKAEERAEADGAEEVEVATEPAAADETPVVASQKSMAVIDDLIKKTRSAREHALNHICEMVESTSFDKAADIFAEVAREERAIVKYLSIRKWQTKLELAQTSVEKANINVATLLRRMAQGNDNGEPASRSERGREVLERQPPFFDALTLLTSATCRCIGDAERSVGVGLEQGLEQDLDLDCAPPGVLEIPGRMNYAQMLEQMRLGAESALDEAVTSTAQVANWSVESGVEPVPVMLLRHQRRVCRALQRMQSRLMYRLQSGNALPTVAWDAERSGVVDDGDNGATVTVATAIPFIRATKELRVDLEGRRLRGEDASNDMWTQSVRTSMAELERSCNHIQQEVEGFGKYLLGSPSPAEPQPTPAGDGELSLEGEQMEADQNVLPADVRSVLLLVSKFAEEIKA